MKRYKITSREGKTVILEAANLHGAVEIIRERGLSGRLVEIKPSTPTAPTPAGTVKVTCGWGPQAHSWATTKAEAIAHRNRCPEHRS